jgi:hypothetical protein
MFIGIGRKFGRNRRWFALLGGRVRLLEWLLYILIGGFILYCLIVGHTPS